MRSGLPRVTSPINPAAAAAAAAAAAIPCIKSTSQLSEVVLTISKTTICHQIKFNIPVPVDR